MRTVWSGFPHYLVPRYLRMLVMSGYFLDSSSRILDFGCGAGHEVHHFRDAGFDASGFDMHDYLELRRPEDREFFQVVSGPNRDPANFSFNWNHFKLPYEDGTFDFIYSSTVLEHVQNMEVVMRELTRVMKPTSIAFHVYPSRYIFIEPHIYVPYGSLFRNYAYFLFWAMVGVRNSFQQQLNWRQVARQNTDYARTGLNYLPPSQIVEICKRYFPQADFVPELWEYDSLEMRRKMQRGWYIGAGTRSRGTRCFG